VAPPRGCGAARSRACPSAPCGRSSARVATRAHRGLGSNGEPRPRFTIGHEPVGTGPAGNPNPDSCFSGGGRCLASMPAARRRGPVLLRPA
jgi:hypothetical protein